MLEQIEQIQSTSLRAIKLMAEHSVAPLPQNYEIWYAYATNNVPDLVQAINAWMQSGSPFKEEIAADLKSRFLEGSHDTSAFNRVGERLSEELQKLTSTLAAAGDDTTVYGQALRGAAGALDGDSDASTIQSVVSDLAKATREMEQCNSALESRLRNSTEEVHRLRSDIETVRRQSLTDQLTGIANRKCFEERLHEAAFDARENQQTFSLIIGDIDHFKRFNDTWGHKTGDQVLKLVARSLTENVKGRDTPARYGGEEFAVILPRTALADALRLAEQIRSSIEAKKIVKRSTGQVLSTITMSMGVAEYKPEQSLDELIERADAALYRAKRAGRNLVHSADDSDGSRSDAA